MHLIRRATKAVGNAAVRSNRSFNRFSASMDNRIVQNPASTVGVLAGAAALAIPGAEPEGASELLSSAGVSTSSVDEFLTQFAKPTAAATAFVADANECYQSPGFSSCTGAALGGLSFANPATGSIGALSLGWDLARLASGG
jgi:hypothetical protein